MCHVQDKYKCKKHDQCKRTQSDRVGKEAFLSINGLITDILGSEVAALGEIELGGIAAKQQNCAGGDGILCKVNGNDLAGVIGGLLSAVVAAKRACFGKVDTLFQNGGAGQVKNARALVVYGKLALLRAEATGSQNDVAVGNLFNLIGALYGNFKQLAAQLKCGIIDAADRALLAGRRVDDGHGTGGLDQGGVSDDHVVVQVKGESAAEIIADGQDQVGLKLNGRTIALCGGVKCLVQGVILANGLAVNNYNCHFGGFAGTCCNSEYGDQRKKRAQHE